MRGFVYAAQGITGCVRSERNFRFHLCAAGLVLWFAARYYAFSPVHWAVLLLTVAAVLALEALNSAIERAVDAAVAYADPLAGQAKDIAAGAVLLLCFGAVGVGVALFWQPAVVSAILVGWVQNWHRPVLLALYLAAGAVFVFRTPVNK